MKKQVLQRGGVAILTAVTALSLAGCQSGPEPSSNSAQSDLEAATPFVSAVRSADWEEACTWLTPASVQNVSGESDDRTCGEALHSVMTWYDYDKTALYPANNPDDFDLEVRGEYDDHTSLRVSGDGGSHVNFDVYLVNDAWQVDLEPTYP